MQVLQGTHQLASPAWVVAFAVVLGPGRRALSAGHSFAESRKACTVPPPVSGAPGDSQRVTGAHNIVLDDTKNWSNAMPRTRHAVMSSVLPHALYMHTATGFDRITYALASGQ